MRLHCIYLELMVLDQKLVLYLKVVPKSNPMMIFFSSVNIFAACSLFNPEDILLSQFKKKSQRKDGGVFGA
jgi:hypothetical protein